MNNSRRMAFRPPMKDSTAIYLVSHVRSFVEK
jgi:hypothetical protein